MKTQIRAAHASYINNLQFRNPKQFYKHIASTTSSKLSTFLINDPASGLPTNCPSKLVNIFATEFAKNFVDADYGHGTLPPETYCKDSITDINISTDSVINALDGWKNGGLSGPDNLPCTLLKNCAAVVSPFIARLFNATLKFGAIPNEWSTAYVIPVFKKGNKLNASNYRPISITSPLCKMLEKFIANHILNFSLEHDIIPPSQHGFIPGRSVSTNLLSCINDWTLQLDKKQPVDVIYIDFCKAFDVVQTPALLYKLNHHGVRGNLSNWISAFLNARSFSVNLLNTVSKEIVIQSGVVQGSVLGPILFTIFVADLPTNFKSPLSCFADDTKFYNNPITNEQTLRDDLLSLSCWCDLWRMSVNSSKCMVMHIGKNNPRLKYMLNSVPLLEVDEARDLGILITYNLKWETHIQTIVKKSNSMLYLINKSFPCVNPATMLNIYKTYVRPILEFAAVIHSPAYLKDILLLESVQRRFTKRLPGLFNLTYDARLKTLNLMSLEQRRLRGDLIDCYKWVHNKYRSNVPLFTPTLAVHLRGHSKKLSVITCRTDVRKYFFCARIISKWNALPGKCIDSISVSAFKHSLDQLPEFLPAYSR